jgi:hypothetical protein
VLVLETADMRANACMQHGDMPGHRIINSGVTGSSKPPMSCWIWTKMLSRPTWSIRRASESASHSSEGLNAFGRAPTLTSCRQLHHVTKGRRLRRCGAPRFCGGPLNAAHPPSGRAYGRPNVSVEFSDAGYPAGTEGSGLARETSEVRLVDETAWRTAPLRLRAPWPRGTDRRWRRRCPTLT